MAYHSRRVLDSALNMKPPSLTVLLQRTQSARAWLSVLLVLTTFVVACGQPTNGGIAPSSSEISAGHTFVLFPEPVLGVTVDQDMQVLDVEANSPAARAGVQPGDILETLDDVDLQALDGKAKGKQLIGNAEFGQHLRLRVQRNGQRAELDVVSAPRPGHANQPTPTPVHSPNYYY